MVPENETVLLCNSRLPGTLSSRPFRRDEDVILFGRNQGRAALSPAAHAARATRRVAVVM